MIGTFFYQEVEKILLLYKLLNIIFNFYLAYFMPLTIIIASSFLKCYRFDGVKLVTWLGAIVIMLSLLLFYSGFTIFIKQLFIVYLAIIISLISLSFLCGFLNYDLLNFEKKVEGNSLNYILVIFYIVLFLHFADYWFSFYQDLIQAKEAAVRAEEHKLCYERRLRDEVRHQGELGKLNSQMSDLQYNLKGCRTALIAIAVIGILTLLSLANR